MRVFGEVNFGEVNFGHQCTGRFLCVVSLNQTLYQTLRPYHIKEGKTESRNFEKGGSKHPNYTHLRENNGMMIFVNKI